MSKKEKKKGEKIQKVTSQCSVQCDSFVSVSVSQLALVCFARLLFGAEIKREIFNTSNTK